MRTFFLTDEPYILKTPEYSKVAVQRGTSAYLKCRVIAVPEADFTWHMTSTLSQSTKEVHPTDPNRGESVLDLKRVHGEPNTYDSLLKLDNVRTEHYSTVFKCVANNSFGSDAHHIELVPPGIPDKPSRISIVQTTPNSVRLSWVPGFDGGYNQTFAITVLLQRTGREVKFKVLEANEHNWWLNETTINNLKPETSYLIRIQAKNKAGLSEVAEEIFVKTRGKYERQAFNHFWLQVGLVEMHCEVRVRRLFVPIASPIKLSLSLSLAHRHVSRERFLAGLRLKLCSGKMRDIESGTIRVHWKLVARAGENFLMASNGR